MGAEGRGQFFKEWVSKLVQEVQVRGSDPIGFRGLLYSPGVGGGGGGAEWLGSPVRAITPGRVKFAPPADHQGKCKIRGVSGWIGRIGGGVSPVVVFLVEPYFCYRN